MYFLVKDFVGLQCGHQYCTDCYRKYLTNEIMEEGATDLICCPAKNCNKIVRFDFIMQLILDEQVREKYHDSMINNFVQVINFIRSWFQKINEVIHKIRKIMWIFFLIFIYFCRTIVCCVGVRHRIVD